MSYLLDKKIKRKKFFYYIFFVIIFLVLFYFRSSVANGLSYASHKLFRPFLILSNNVGDKLGNIGSFFISKSSLYKENMDIKFQLSVNKNTLANHDSVLAENTKIKEILGRKDPKTVMVLSAILGKQDKNSYDSLIIDIGAKNGLQIGDTVFALGNVPIGRISAVYPDSSKVTLFSNSGEKTQVVVGSNHIFLEIIGRGGGNFEVALPRDFLLLKGDQAVLPGITPYVVAVVEAIISDPRDSFIKALLVSPVNIQELKFVQVKIEN
ncbi:hypothetical protein A3A05_00355 [Candidatus Nomurabacteria bacterium RIFCSPLOWO2_01_FULL_41_12]|uniref:Rod shape-determining protein MreC beta-barrel core domain-containing protein n=1 Tax=Candidatus Nomurabacteria bacterium RIFCSPLOWO2_01_FULL_41_12 TaxID=1801774 RepID=A0A1F6WWN4_9BACT|nr:MAG: hypothetical protein A2732_01245 [Candidatus Nomurabacteria bacterium RIFCSPHIGHO2_01_FULL_40_10]OGI86282.1 MAG: hypothetical protein A3A05_00355 [Candidatus Nomurabacteria bacterium RIFCSPLOWO2_01_FULL_41_12]